MEGSHRNLNALLAPCVLVLTIFLMRFLDHLPCSLSSAFFSLKVNILSELNHPCIVRYVESFSEEGILYIIQEYADGGDLLAVCPSVRWNV